MAQDQVARRHLGNVTVLQADVMASGLQNCSFDFAHERLVMVNMSSPIAVAVFRLITSGISALHGNQPIINGRTNPNST